MDQKYVDALLSSLKAQRDAALDEAARLNATLILVASQRDGAQLEADSFKKGLSGALNDLPLAVASDEAESILESLRGRLGALIDAAAAPLVKA